MSTNWAAITSDIRPTVRGKRHSVRRRRLTTIEILSAAMVGGLLAVGLCYTWIAQSMALRAMRQVEVINEVTPREVAPSKTKQLLKVEMVKKH